MSKLFIKTLQQAIRNDDWSLVNDVIESMGGEPVAVEAQQERNILTELPRDEGTICTNVKAKESPGGILLPTQDDINELVAEGVETITAEPEPEQPARIILEPSTPIEVPGDMSPAEMESDRARLVSEDRLEAAKASAKVIEQQQTYVKQLTQKQQPSADGDFVFRRDGDTQAQQPPTEREGGGTFCRTEPYKASGMNAFVDDPKVATREAAFDKKLVKAGVRIEGRMVEDRPPAKHVKLTCKECDNEFDVPMADAALFLKRVTPEDSRKNNFTCNDCIRKARRNRGRR